MIENEKKKKQKSNVQTNRKKKKKYEFINIYTGEIFAYSLSDDNINYNYRSTENEGGGPLRLFTRIDAKFRDFETRRNHKKIQRYRIIIKFKGIAAVQYGFFNVRSTSPGIDNVYAINGPGNVRKTAVPPRYYCVRPMSNLANYSILPSVQTRCTNVST